MALALNSSCLQSQSSVTRSTKVFASLKSQSTIAFGTTKPSLNVQFYNKVFKSLNSRTCNKRTRMRIQMMPIGTPMVPYRTPGEKSWQMVDLWNFFYRERVIWIGQHIDEEFSNQIVATMLYLDSIDSKKLVVNVYIPSGDTTPTLALYDTMQYLRCPVATRCLGYAFDLATFIVAAGDKGDRSAMPYSRFILRPISGAARGQADTVQIEANELLKVRDYLHKELAKQTGQPIEQIK
ncbi:hypothetical protein AQUCO_03000344v1 [Aquilegia coerulea]|uniref:ATP-dependent Clp protease proteolytic subunit n=1 Tax=Aquilegia coerulea TaxID=218851 RepID=A0A2G5D2L4_AQUCA|nr:hypothetical protein AQUCO_03000344v1 [Aquilegia coerulea]